MDCSPKKKGMMKKAVSASKKDGKGGFGQMAHTTPAFRKPGIESGVKKAVEGIKEKAKTVGSAIKEVYSSPEERKKIQLKETLGNMSKVRGPMSPFKPMPESAKGVPQRGLLPRMKKPMPKIQNSKLRPSTAPKIKPLITRKKAV